MNLTRLIPIVAILLTVVFVLAVTPSKISPQAKTTIYFDNTVFGAAATPACTLVWSKARAFTDTSYTVSAFLAGKTATGILRYSVLDDSSLRIVTSAATDSNKTFSYQVLLQKH